MLFRSSRDAMLTTKIYRRCKVMINDTTSENPWNIKFGKNGLIYFNFARGMDDRPVEAVRIRKSIGCEHTLEKDLSAEMSLIIELYHVARELTDRLKAKEFKGNTLTLKVKFDDFSQITRSVSVERPFQRLDDILPLAKRLLKGVDYSHDKTDW